MYRSKTGQLAPKEQDNSSPATRDSCDTHLPLGTVGPILKPFDCESPHHQRGASTLTCLTCKREAFLCLTPLQSQAEHANADFPLCSDCSDTDVANDLALCQCKIGQQCGECHAARLRLMHAKRQAFVANGDQIACFDCPTALRGDETVKKCAVCEGLVYAEQGT